MKKKLISIIVLISVICMAVSIVPVQVFAIGSYGVDLSSPAYQSYTNPFYPNYAGSADGSGGQCTWYAWGRAYEKTGAQLPCRGNAKDWGNQCGSFLFDNTPSTNSIIVSPNGGYTDDNGVYHQTGHVMFVEYYENGYAYISEGNYSKHYHEDTIRINGNTGIRSGGGSFTITGYIHLDPYVNLGDDFYAVILNTDIWTPISRVSDSNNIYMQTENGSSMQTWRFMRQSDNAYVIKSCKDGKVLEMSDPDNRQNQNPIYTITDDFWGGYYQQWYIIPNNGGYVILSKHFVDEEWAMDYNATTNGVQIYKRNNSKYQTWSIYKGDDVQLRGPKLTLSTDDTTGYTTFTWENVYGESGYNLKIYRGSSIDYSDQYKVIWNAESGCKLSLPSGTYYAYVDSYDYFHYKQGNIVQFTIEKDGNDVVVIPYGDDFFEGKDYAVNGNVITVTHDVPCKVGYLNSDGGYVAIDGILLNEGSNIFTFTAPEGVTEVILVVKGDATGDGSVNLGDAARIKAVFRHKTELDPVSEFAADVNGDGSLNLGDAAQITAVFRKKTTIQWN